jgi:outer membrane protein
MRTGNSTFPFWFRFTLALSLFSGWNIRLTVAQESWSLQRCIEYAKDNSLTLRQAGYGIELAKLTDLQNQQSRYPTINGSVNGGMQFGRTIDPVTNSFDNQRITFNNLGIDANWTLYSGGRITNTIKQGKINVEAAEEDARTSFNTLAISIANSFLQILMAEEQLEAAQKRKELSNQQLSQTDKLIQAGTIPANDRLDVLAQIARDEQTIIAAQNLIDINLLNLKELMQLDPNTDIKIERPQVPIPADTNPDEMTFRETYSSALSTQPQIKAEELRMQSSELGVDIARGALLPTLVLFGGIDTRWSSASKVITSRTPTIVTDTVYIDNTPVPVGFPSEDITTGKNPYLDQLDQNFGQNVGLALSIPLYNNGRNKIGIQRAQVGVQQARLQNDLTRQQLKTDVQAAIANARAGKRSLEASQKSVDAAQIAYENAEKRFRLGAINNLQLLTARNTLDIAQTNLISAKYEYLFRLKILDLLTGKPLKLE